MSTLSTLIKRTKQSLEALQKEMSELEKHTQRLETEQKRLRAEADKSFTDAQKSDDPQQMFMALHFIARQDAQILILKEQQHKIGARKEELNAQIRAHFAEQKRYEILEERQRAEKRATIMKKQQAELDDLAQREKP